jgi:hypothetical protein
MVKLEFPVVIGVVLLLCFPMPLATNADSSPDHRHHLGTKQ